MLDPRRVPRQGELWKWPKLTGKVTRFIGNFVANGFENSVLAYSIAAILMVRGLAQASVFRRRGGRAKGLI